MPIGRWVKGNFQVAHVVQGNDHIVYFVQCGKDGPVKIGFSGDGWGRIKDLSTAMPYRAGKISIVVGGRQLERRLHQRFKRYRLNGEWFKPEGELKALMRKLPRSEPRELARCTLNILGEQIAVIPVGVPHVVRRK